ncbi:MAG: hypothetical protein R3C53_28195 [Pirellulaceae bacterium]
MKSISRWLAAALVLACVLCIGFMLAGDERAWRIATLIYRVRYSLLGMLAPIVFLALGTGSLKSYLSSVFVLRNQPGRFRFNRYYMDLYNITWLGGMLAMTSLATAQVTLNWGDQRFGDPRKFAERPVVGDHSTENGLIHLSESPIENFAESHELYIGSLIIALLLSAVLPIAACVLSIRQGVPDRLRFHRNERGEPYHVPRQSHRRAGLSSAATIAAGYGFVALVMLGLAWLQNYMLQPESIGSRVNPFELLEWFRNGASQRGGFTVFLDTVASGLTYLPVGEGYLSSSGHWLPGHPQMLLLGAVSTVVYIAWYAFSSVDKTWQATTWPVLFYVLILFYLIAWIMPGLAFLFDWYGIPPSLLVFAAIFLIGKIFRVDHRFHLLRAAQTSAMQERLQATNPSGTETHPNAFIQAIERRPVSSRQGEKVEQQEQDTSVDPCYWSQYLEKHFANHPVDQRTLVVVTASGGGIQAAVWATKVLHELDKAIPQFANSIGLFSAVSGGSTGVMQYLAHRGWRPNHGSQQALHAASLAAHHAASHSSLEAVAWGVTFPDFVRLLAPPLVQFGDRGWALEASWWNQLGRTASDRSLIENVRMSDLARLTKERLLPPTIFNATSVETGQRVLFGSIRGDCGTLPLSSATKAAVVTGERIDEPIDYDQFLQKALAETTVAGRDIRATTAVRLSATFAYVTPVARAYSNKLNSLLRRRTSRELSEELKAEAKLSMHICDGGYSDNSGLVTAVTLLRDVLELNENLPDQERLFDRVLVLRIEPFPPSLQSFQAANQGLYSQLFGPSTALDSARKSTQAERGELELELLRKRFPIVQEVLCQFGLETPERPPLTWRLAPNDLHAIEEEWMAQQQEIVSRVVEFFA